MENVTEIFQRRDKLSRKEAEKQTQEVRSSIYDIIDEGGSYDDIEDMMLNDYGLEMDYLMDLI